LKTFASSSTKTMPEALKLFGKRVYDLYEPCEPFATGFLALDHGHQMYFEQCGRPDGVPVVFLHGGPGAGASPAHRRFFDPDYYRIIIFDQRGAGRSRPLGSLENNTTSAIVGDIERLRVHLGIESWIVFGGSWGSTLALAYAGQHRAPVIALVLRGIFLGRARELDWFLHGMRNFYPEAWQAFTHHLPFEERAPLLESYYRRLASPDPTVHLPAARAWSAYEAACSTLLPNQDVVSNYANDSLALGLARIEAHYFTHQMWLEEDTLLAVARTLGALPGVIVQGRYDVVCPPASAYELAAAWPGAKLVLVPDAGHSAFEPGIRSELVGAMEGLKSAELG
jgi:proline iminopeptidase